MRYCLVKFVFFLGGINFFLNKSRYVKGFLTLLVPAMTLWPFGFLFNSWIYFVQPWEPNGAADKMPALQVDFELAGKSNIG